MSLIEEGHTDTSRRKILLLGNKNSAYQELCRNCILYIENKNILRSVRNTAAAHFTGSVKSSILVQLVSPPHILALQNICCLLRMKEIRLMIYVVLLNVFAH